MRDSDSMKAGGRFGIEDRDLEMTTAFATRRFPAALYLAEAVAMNLPPPASELCHLDSGSISSFELVPLRSSTPFILMDHVDHYAAKRKGKEVEHIRLCTRSYPPDGTISGGRTTSSGRDHQFRVTPSYLAIARLTNSLTGLRAANLVSCSIGRNTDHSSAFSSVVVGLRRLPYSEVLGDLGDSGNDVHCDCLFDVWIER